MCLEPPVLLALLQFRCRLESPFLDEFFEPFLRPLVSLWSVDGIGQTVQDPAKDPDEEGLYLRCDRPVCAGGRSGVGARLALYFIGFPVFFKTRGSRVSYFPSAGKNHVSVAVKRGGPGKYLISWGRAQS